MGMTMGGDCNGGWPGWGWSKGRDPTGSGTGPRARRAKEDRSPLGSPFGCKAPKGQTGAWARPAASSRVLCPARAGPAGRLDPAIIHEPQRKRIIQLYKSLIGTAYLNPGVFGAKLKQL